MFSITFLRRSLCLTLFLLALVHAVPALAQDSAPRVHITPVTRNSAKSKVEITLAKDGKALLPIVVSPQATDEIKAIATELAQQLKRITGAEYSVETGDGARGIVIGTLQEFPNPQLNEPLKIYNTYDGREAFAIRTEPNRVLLIGNTRLGVSHAAFRFLELLGYRHFFPAPEWEVVPQKSTLTFGWNETDRPTLLSRRIWYAYGIFTQADNHHRPDERARADFAAWSRHNRMAASLTINAGHAWHNIVRQNKKEFDAHPEYYALVNGKRTSGANAKLELGNPAVRRMFVDYAINYFNKYPDRDMVSLDPTDGGGFSESPESKALGTISDAVFGMANEVAKALQKEHPGKMVGMLAYNFHTDPPSFDLEPNVYVQRATSFVKSKYSSQERMELWARRAKWLGFYDYYSVWYWDFDKFPGGNANNMQYLRERIPMFAKYGATSIDAESGNNWGIHGRGYYIANRLMWNPDADVDALLADFYEKAFGPAAPAMKRYYERVQRGGPARERQDDEDEENAEEGGDDGGGFISEHHIAMAFRDVEEASRLAKDRPDVQARLDHIKQYLRYIHLRWEIDHAPDKETKKQMTLAAWTNVFRSRYSYMNHWQAMFYSWKSRAMKEFNAPEWGATHPSPKPWMAIDAPLSHEETEALFQEGLKRFQPSEVTQIEYSADLVPARFGEEPKSGDGFNYQGVAHHVIYSSGQPVSVTVKTSSKSKPPGFYTLQDKDGREVAAATLPGSGITETLTWRLPRGAYLLTFHDNNAGWSITPEAGQPLSYAPQRNQKVNGRGNKPLYFYVPKGTREIVYYWAGGKHAVHGPDGQLVKEITDSGDFMKVPVPTGADGKVWSFQKMVQRNLWFFTVPNYLSRSAGVLLIPREVAQKDGLAIVE